MTFATLLCPRATEHPSRWELDVVPKLTSPAGLLSGGAALGITLNAMASSTGRTPVCATAQYQNTATIGTRVSIAVEHQAGRHTTQARAVLRSHERTLLTVQAALVEARPSRWHSLFQAPDVPPAVDCAMHAVASKTTDTILEFTEIRLASGRTWPELDGTPGPGSFALWFRLPGGKRAYTAAELAVVADFLPLATSQSLGRPAAGTSLDNTLRVCAGAPTEWVLLSCQIDGIADRLAHGTAHLWAEDGTLLALASQSLIVRRPEVAGLNHEARVQDA